MTSFNTIFRLAQKHFNSMTCLKFSNRCNSIHHSKQFHTCFILSSIFNVCIDGIKNTINSSNISEGFEYKLPSSSWMLQHRPNSIQSIQKDFIDITRKTVSALKCRHIMKEKITVAIDVTKKPRYDKKNHEYLKRSKPKAGTSLFETYCTMQCVVSKQRLHLAIAPMYNHHSSAESVPKLIDMARQTGVRIKMILLDREFYSAQVFRDLTRKRIPFVIPCKNTPYVKQAIKEFDQDKRRSVSLHTIESTTIKEEFTMIITSRRAYKNTKDIEDDPKPHSKYIAFATNLPKEYVRDHAQELVNQYSKRWGIETGYSVHNKIRPRTTSRDPILRMFCFIYGMLMCNAWILVQSESYLRNLKKMECIRLASFCKMWEARLLQDIRITKPPYLGAG